MVLHRQVSSRQVIADAQVPLKLRNMLEGLCGSEELHSLRLRVFYQGLEFSIDLDYYSSTLLVFLQPELDVQIVRVLVYDPEARHSNIKNITNKSPIRKLGHLRAFNFVNCFTFELKV